MSWGGREKGAGAVVSRMTYRLDSPKAYVILCIVIRDDGILNVSTVGGALIDYSDRGRENGNRWRVS